MEFLKTFFADLVSAPALKRGARTAVFSFVFLFGASLAGWLQQVAEWASANEDAVSVFPDVAVLGKAFVSAVAAAGAGLVGAVVNAFENAKGGSSLFGAKTNRLD